MRELPRDLRYALRTLARAPGFAAAAVLTIALAIGANTAVFTLVNAVILQPLPFHASERLVAAWETYLPQFRKVGVSPLEVQAWSQQSDLFEQSAWYRYVPKSINLSEPGAEAMEAQATCVPDRFFSLLGVPPVLGRTFRASEDPNSAILSARLWQSRFGGDRGIAGKTILIDEKPFRVIGVMPENFRFPDFAEVWLTPAQMADEMTNPVRHAVGFLARLRADRTVKEAAARIESVAQRLAAEHPKTSRGWGARLSSLQQDVTASARPALLMLFGAVVMVLLIACANISNLLLARAGARAREISIRAALGCGGWRIVRQLLTESVVLASVGGALGLALGRLTLTLLAPEPQPLEPAVLIFVLVTSLGAGIVFGLAPAVHAWRSDPIAAIKNASGIGGSSRLRSVLIVAEFALSLMLVAGAGVLVKSFVRLMHVNPGFDPRGVLSMRVAIPPSRNPVELFHRIQQRLLQLPGVQSVAATSGLPLVASRANTSRFNVPGSPLIDPDALPAAQIRIASPGYFKLMRIPLRFGRTFTEHDLTEPVVVINETMARRFWPGRNPVGLKYVTGPWGPTPQWSTIVGVVGDVKQFGLDSEASMDEYFPSLGGQELLVRVAGNPSSIATAVTRAIHSVDAGAPVSEVRTMDDVLGESAHARRWTMGLLAAFAGLALMLALIGIYGVVSWTVSQRRREIGIRMALGAEARDVTRMMLRYAMKLTVAGIAMGVAGAFALRTVLASLVFDVSAADPAIYTGAAVLMVIAAVAACWVPTRRAARVDPLAALRWE